jgi:hypothetical protein
MEGTYVELGRCLRSYTRSDKYPVAMLATYEIPPPHTCVKIDSSPRSRLLYGFPILHLSGSRHFLLENPCIVHRRWLGIREIILRCPF